MREGNSTLGLDIKDSARLLLADENENWFFSVPQGCFDIVWTIYSTTKCFPTHTLAGATRNFLISTWKFSLLVKLFSRFLFNNFCPPVYWHIRKICWNDVGICWPNEHKNCTGLVANRHVTNRKQMENFYLITENKIVKIKRMKIEFCCFAFSHAFHFQLFIAESLWDENVLLLLGQQNASENIRRRMSLLYCAIKKLSDSSLSMNARILH